MLDDIRLRRFMPGLIVNTDLTDTLRRIGAAAAEVILLCDALDDSPLWIKNSAGTYQWVNTSFFLNFGFSQRDEVIGKSDFDLCDPLLAEQYKADDLRVLAGEAIHARVELIGRFDHSTRWCSTTKIPLHDPQGRVVGTAGITKPIRSSQWPAGELLGPAIKRISENARSGTLSNSELAGSCNLSQRAFERHFQARYHCTPQHYIRQLRARLCCHPLAFSDQPLAAIAMEHGFTDQSHFTREFRRFFGETPGLYRKRHRV